MTEVSKTFSGSSILSSPARKAPYLRCFLYAGLVNLMIRLWKNEDMTALVFYIIFDEQMRLCVGIIIGAILWRNEIKKSERIVVDFCNSCYTIHSALYRMYLRYKKEGKYNGISTNCRKRTLFFIHRADSWDFDARSRDRNDRGTCRSGLFHLWAVYAL